MLAENRDMEPGVPKAEGGLGSAISVEGSVDTERPEAMDCNFGASISGVLPQAVVVILIADKEYPTMIDTGCIQTLIRESLVALEVSEPTVPKKLICVHGECQVYPRRKLKITKLGQTLPVGMAIGNA